MAVEIRAAAASDDAALHALDRATWSPVVSPGPAPSGERSFAEWPREVLVAVSGSVVAGYVQFGPVTSLSSNAHVWEISGLAVGSGHRGMGIGRALVEACVAELRSRGARRVRLRVLSGNVAARALYESCGFGVEGVLREEFLLDGDYVDDVLMARAI